jgi:NADH dehydrogenase [ubiquinone] 1 alpha subcomplex assembly factor 7
MNKAEKQVREIIERDGRITVEEFFKISTEYYYNSKDPFGVKGDFTTAPEISQLFGEMLGVWIANTWINIGMPKFNLVEMGAGRGTLMSDILRATKNVAGFKEAMQGIIIIENSEYLSNLQKEKLKDYEVSWVKTIEEVEHKNCIFVCNELFDALSFKQYLNGKERGIILRNGEYTFDDVNEEGTIIEVSDYSKALCDQIRSISKAALIIDYGYIQAPGVSTLQAVKSHKKVGIFDFIGEADLTYHVDFLALLSLFPNSTIKTMAAFLKENGIDVRAQKLMDAGYNIAKMQSELTRLLSSSQMGELFKVLEYKA